MTTAMYYPCCRVMTLPTVSDALDQLNVRGEMQRMFQANAAISQSTAIIVPDEADPATVAIVQYGTLEGITGAHILVGFVDAMEESTDALRANWVGDDSGPVYVMEYRECDWGTA